MQYPWEFEPAGYLVGQSDALLIILKMMDHDGFTEKARNLNLF